uniref:MSP domain-containing protein n=1 Tax=Arion vulgaris TaxID=1028688 RepID=A0A0B6ZV22_9EUPU
MASKDQALLLDPPGELRFKGPFLDVVTADLKLTNPTDKRVCFKVKTTAPKRYCVRPNSGILEPQKSIAVAVMLQPFDYDPNEKNKHKFMVQSMYAPDIIGDSQENLWKDAPPESLMDTKLKCVFEVPDGQQQRISPEATRSLESVPIYSDSIFDDSSRKVESPKKPSSASSDDVRKVQLDLKRIQAEISSLKAENNQLKGERMRLRDVAMKDTVMSTPSHHVRAASHVKVHTFPPVVYIIAAILIGLIIGKFLL